MNLSIRIEIGGGPAPCGDYLTEDEAIQMAGELVDSIGCGFPDVWMRVAYEREEGGWTVSAEAQGQDDLVDFIDDLR